MWYRIELNEDRSVRTCVEVSGSLNEGRSVHYIEADSKASAIAILANAYAKRINGARAHEAARRRARQCVRCVSPAVTARFCRLHADADNARNRDIRNGVRAPKKQRRNLTPAEAAGLEVARRARDTELKNKRVDISGLSKYQFEHAVRRAKVLSEVLEAFDRDPGAFRAWLVAKIAECQEKIDGKKTIADHFPAQAAE